MKVTAKNQHEGLRKSRAHWKRLATGKHKKGEGIYAEDCALCSLYLVKDCHGCPISAKTGEPGCRGTPYRMAVDEWRCGRKQSAEFRREAAKMWGFLKTVKPTVKRGKV